MRISDWSSDVCSSDLGQRAAVLEMPDGQRIVEGPHDLVHVADARHGPVPHRFDRGDVADRDKGRQAVFAARGPCARRDFGARSEEHTSELQSLMRISYAVFCLKKKINNTKQNKNI